MSDTIRAALLFLINSIFDIYLFIIIARIILAWVSADYQQPFTQFIVKCTSFIVKPMRRFIPNYRDLETASIVLLLVVEIIKFFLIAVLSFGLPNIGGLLILAVGDAIKLTLQLFFYAILFQAILSWLQPGSPMSLTLNQFTSPIMRPLQRVIPPVGGFDISPIPALIILQLLIIILVNPLMAMGVSAAFR